MPGGVCACSKGYRGANCPLNLSRTAVPTYAAAMGMQFVGQAKPPAQSKEASPNSSELPATGAAAATAPEARFRQQPTAESRSHRAQLSPQQSLVPTESNPEYSSLLQVEDSPGDRELRRVYLRGRVDRFRLQRGSGSEGARQVEIPPPLQEISGNVAASPSAAQKMDIPVVDSKAKVQKERKHRIRKQTKQTSDTAPATSSTSGSADAAAADDSCKQDAECAHLKNPLLAKSVPVCCDGTCTLKQKSWKGKWVCPADCVGHFWKERDLCKCSSSLDCTGKRVGCCNKKCAKKEKRGIFGIYSCPKDHSFRSAASTVGIVATTPESTEPASCAGDLEHCSGHGICYENRCYCNPPYAGTSCATGKLLQTCAAA